MDERTSNDSDYYLSSQNADRYVIRSIILQHDFYFRLHTDILDTHVVVRFVRVNRRRLFAVIQQRKCVTLAISLHGMCMDG